MSLDSINQAEQFGAFVRDAAQRAGYNLSSPRSGGMTQLAKDTGISQAAASRLLAGYVIPEAKSLEPLARALGVPVLDLLARAGIVSGAVRSAADYPELTEQAALVYLGVANPADQAVILAVIDRLNSRPAVE